MSPEKNERNCLDGVQEEIPGLRRSLRVRNMTATCLTKNPINETSVNGSSGEQESSKRFCSNNTDCDKTPNSLMETNSEKLLDTISEVTSGILVKDGEKNSFEDIEPLTESDLELDRVKQIDVASKDNKENLQDNGQVADEAKDTINGEIDRLLLEGIGDPPSDDSGHENAYIDFEADEGAENTPSEGSNDIPERGEDLNTTDTEYSSDDSYDRNSFIDDDLTPELLPGEEFDLSLDSPRKKSRIVQFSDGSDDEIVNLEKFRKPVKKRTKSRIVKLSDSSEDDTGAISKLTPKEQIDENTLKNSTCESSQTPDAFSCDIAEENNTIAAEVTVELEAAEVEVELEAAEVEVELEAAEVEVDPRKEVQDLGNKNSILLSSEQNENYCLSSDGGNKECVRESSVDEENNTELGEESVGLVKTEVLRVSEAEMVGDRQRFGDLDNGDLLNNSEQSLNGVMNEEPIPEATVCVFMITHQDLRQRKIKKRKRSKAKTLTERNNFVKNRKKFKSEHAMSVVEDALCSANKIISHDLRSVNNDEWNVNAINITPSATNGEVKVKKPLKCETKPKFHPKDFKNMMLYDIKRVKRMDTRTMLKKKY